MHHTAEMDPVKLVSLPAEDWLDEAIGLGEPPGAGPQLAEPPLEELEPDLEIEDGRRIDFRLVTSPPGDVARVTPVTALWLDGRLLFSAVPEVAGAEDPNVFRARLTGVQGDHEHLTIAGVAERIADGDPVNRFLAAHEDKYGYRPDLEENDACVYALLPS
jgi:hypothetical protein